MPMTDFYMFGETPGYKNATLHLKFEVCGTEIIKPSDKYTKTIHAWSQSKYSIPFETMSNYFTVSSGNCPVASISIVFPRLQPLSNLLFRNQTSVPDIDLTNIISIQNGSLIVNQTTLNLHFPFNLIDFELEAKTYGNVIAYKKMKLAIRNIIMHEIQSDNADHFIVNGPSFQSDPDLWLVNVTSKQNFSSEADRYKLFTSPPAVDPKNQPIEIEFKGVDEISSFASFNVSDYSGETLSFSLQVDKKEIRSSDHGLHEFQVVLMNPESSREVTFKLEINYQEIKEEEETTEQGSADPQESQDDDIPQQLKAFFNISSLRAAKSKSVDPSNVFAPPQMTLHSVSSRGVLKLKFDDRMLVPSDSESINYQDIFEIIIVSILDGSSIKGQYRNKTTRALSITEECQEDCDALLKSFSWEVLKFKDQLIDIQLYADDAKHISATSFGKDRIIIKVLKPEVFISDVSGKTIELAEEEELQFNHQIPQLIYDEEIVRMLETSSQQISASVTLTTSGNMALNLLIKCSLQQLWGMIRSLQMNQYQALIEINYPAHTSVFMQLMASIAELDLLNGEGFFDTFFNLLETPPFTEHFELYNYSSMNFLLNSGSVILIAFLLVLLKLSQKVLSYYSKRYYQHPLWRQVGMMLENQESLLVQIQILVAEAYLELGMAMVLQFHSYRSEFWTQLLGLGNFTCFLTFSLTFASILAYPIIILSSCFHKDEQTGFYQEYIYFQGLKQQSLVCRLYRVWHMVLRALLVLILVGLHDLPYFQCMLSLILITINFCFVFVVKPYESDTENLINQTNEFFILVFCHLNYMFLVEYPSSEFTSQFKDLVGWLVILQSISSILFNLCLIVKVSVHETWQSIIHTGWYQYNLNLKARNRIKNKKRLLHTFDGMFPQIQEQADNLDAMVFCKQWKKQRDWCLAYGLDVSVLPEEKQFRKIIREKQFNTKFQIIEKQRKVLEVFARVNKLAPPERNSNKFDQIYAKMKKRTLAKDLLSSWKTGNLQTINEEQVECTQPDQLPNENHLLTEFKSDVKSVHKHLRSLKVKPRQADLEMLRDLEKVYHEAPKNEQVRIDTRDNRMYSVIQREIEEQEQTIRQKEQEATNRLRDLKEVVSGGRKYAPIENEYEFADGISERESESEAGSKEAPGRIEMAESGRKQPSQNLILSYPPEEEEDSASSKDEEEPTEPLFNSDLPQNSVMLASLQILWSIPRIRHKIQNMKAPIKLISFLQAVLKDTPTGRRSLANELQDLSDFIKSDKVLSCATSPIQLAFFLINIVHYLESGSREQLDIDNYQLLPYQQDNLKAQYVDYLRFNVLQSSASQSLTFLLRETTTCQACLLKRVAYKQQNYLCLTTFKPLKGKKPPSVGKLLKLNLEKHKELYESRKCPQCEHTTQPFNRLLEFITLPETLVVMFKPQSKTKVNSKQYVQRFKVRSNMQWLQFQAADAPSSKVMLFKGQKLFQNDVNEGFSGYQGVVQSKLSLKPFASDLAQHSMTIRVPIPKNSAVQVEENPKTEQPATPIEAGSSSSSDEEEKSEDTPSPVSSKEWASVTNSSELFSEIYLDDHPIFQEDSISLVQEIIKKVIKEAMLLSSTESWNFDPITLPEESDIVSASQSQEETESDQEQKEKARLEEKEKARLQLLLKEKERKKQQMEYGLQGVVVIDSAGRFRYLQSTGEAKWTPTIEKGCKLFNLVYTAQW